MSLLICSSADWSWGLMVNVFISGEASHAMGDTSPPSGPDFSKGISSNDLPRDGVLLGQADGESVLLVRRPDAVFAIGAKCTHYSSSLLDGFVERNTIRCPWHHACFDLETG